MVVRGSDPRRIDLDPEPAGRTLHRRQDVGERRRIRCTDEPRPVPGAEHVDPVEAPQSFDELGGDGTRHLCHGGEGREAQEPASGLLGFDQATRIGMERRLEHLVAGLSGLHHQSATIRSRPAPGAPSPARQPASGEPAVPGRTRGRPRVRPGRPGGGPPRCRRTRRPPQSRLHRTRRSPRRPVARPALRAPPGPS